MKSKCMMWSFFKVQEINNEVGHKSGYKATHDSLTARSVEIGNLGM